MSGHSDWNKRKSAKGSQIGNPVVYEGYGPGGVAVIVEVTTDNKTRTVSELRNLFKSHHGHLAEEGSVDYLFGHYGHLVFDRRRYPEDVVMEAALELGAEDVLSRDEVVEVLTLNKELHHTRDAMNKKGLEPTLADSVYIAKITVPIAEKTTGSSLFALFDALEKHPDVQRVHSNFEMQAALFSELAQRA